MKLEIINQNNIHYLEEFIKNDLPSTFRYFNNRDATIIKNHKLTVVLLLPEKLTCSQVLNNLDKPVAYAHIDYAENKYWFGICILPEYQNKGWGKYILKYVIEYAKKININNIYLTVDIINIPGITLYKKFNFNIIETRLTNYLMHLQLSSDLLQLSQDKLVA
jgi:GNAT superfamily N-acetyltransferase